MDGSVWTGGSWHEVIAAMFFAFDGIDGAGKSTQIERLVGYLRSRDRSVVVCRDPGGTALGEQVRKLLLDHSDMEIGVRAETLLYMASRAQLVSEVIEPALRRGDTVISDRFISANVAYQGFGGGMEADRIVSIGQWATAGIMPDLLFVLDLDAPAAAARLLREKDRIESRGLEYFERVRDGFLRLPDLWPGRVVVIDARLSADEVHDRVLQAIAELPGTSDVSPTAPSNRGAGEQR
ncbi:MAG: dTMP kinase [Pirellulaceae bacterium]